MAQAFFNRWKFDPEYIDLLNYFIEITKDATSPINVSKSVVDYKEKSGSSQNLTCLEHRIRRMRAIIHSFEHVDKNTKVKLMFALRGSVDADFLEELKKDAVVEVDDKQRITKYEANDGSLESRGDHSRSAKRKNVKLESKRSLRSLIFNYFENKNDVDAVPKNKEEKEIWNMIEFITEKCENADSPLRIRQLAKDFNKHFGTSRAFSCTYGRIRTYCLEIQTLGIMDAFTTVKQLFCLSATLDPEYLGKQATLRKDAVVEVDNLKRITKYIANNDRLTLNGYHSYSAKKKSGWIESTKKKSAVKKQCNYGGDKDEESDEGDGYLEDDSDEYSSDEFGSEFDSDDEKEDFMEQSNKEDDFDNETPIRSRSPSEISTDDNLDFDTPTEKCHLSGETEMKKVDEKDDSEIAGNVEIETRNFKMTTPISNRWTADPVYVDLLNYLIQKAENAKSPMNIQSLAKEFKEKKGAVQTVNCLNHRIVRIRAYIWSFEHIDTLTKVKLLFALSVSVNAGFLKKLVKIALVEIDDKKRITKYEANDGSFELRGDHSRSAKRNTVALGSKRNYRSMLNSYFEKKNDADAVPDTEEKKEIGNLIEFIIEKCENIDRPLSICQLARDFVDEFQTSIHPSTFQKRIKEYIQEIQRVEFLNIHSTVKQLFGLSATVDSDFLERLRTEARVEIDDKNRITHYNANDGSLELRGDHSASAKNSNAKLESKRSLRSLIKNYFKGKNDVDAVLKNDEEKEMGNFIEFITEKCENVDSPLNITQLTKDFNKLFGSSRSLDCIRGRIKEYCREIQALCILDVFSTVKQLFCLSATLDSEYLGKLRKDAIVEVDELNRITKYIANNGCLVLNGDHSLSAKQKTAKRNNRSERRKNKNVVMTHYISGDDTEEESDEGDGYSEDGNDEYSIEEFDSEFDLNNYDNYIDEPEALMEPSNEAVDFYDDIPVLSPTYMSMDDYFDFDPPTEIFHRPDVIEMMEVFGEENGHRITGNTAVKTRKFETLPSTPQLPKRKVDTSAGSASSKRTKPLPEDFMNLGEMDDNFFYEDPPRIDLNPFRGPIGLSDGIEEKYKEEAHFSLKSVLKSFKSLILNLDTAGLSQFLMELDMKFLESGRRIEVPNKEVILAMELLIVKLAKSGAPESSEESLSLRDILLMLRTIFLNTSFDGVEVILEMLKENIDQLKAQDKMVPVPKVDSALSATLDIICT